MVLEFLYEFDIKSTRWSQGREPGELDVRAGGAMDDNDKDASLNEHYHFALS